MLLEIDARVRYAVYATFAEGLVPRSLSIASRLHVSQQAVKESYERLHAARAIVLDPHTKEVWMAHPFSAVPTDFRVRAEGRDWFANCAWDAFGIAVLTGMDAVLSTTCLDCDGPIVHRVEERRLVDAHGVVHFVVPAAKWWDNIALTCSTIRFFRSEEHVLNWSARTETPIGAIMPVENLWQLTQHWYEGRLSPDWKPRPREWSQELLSDAGFTGSFWTLAG